MIISGSNWMKAPQPSRISNPMTSPKDTPLLPALASGQFRPETLAQRVAAQPALLTEVFAGLGERQARVKFGCAKVLLLVSERNPALLAGPGHATPAHIKKGLAGWLPDRIHPTIGWSGPGRELSLAYLPAGESGQG